MLLNRCAGKLRHRVDEAIPEIFRTGAVGKDRKPQARVDVLPYDDSLQPGYAGLCNRALCELIRVKIDPA